MANVCHLSVRLKVIRIHKSHGKYPKQLFQQQQYLIRLKKILFCPSIFAIKLYSSYTIVISNCIEWVNAQCNEKKKQFTSANVKGFYITYITILYFTRKPTDGYFIKLNMLKYIILTYNAIQFECATIH